MHIETRTSTLNAIDDAKKGNKDTLANKLAHKYCRFIYDVLIKRNIKHHDAEELTHDMFTHVLLKIDKYDQSKGSFGGWLVTLTRNMATDRQRKSDMVIVDEHILNNALLSLDTDIEGLSKIGQEFDPDAISGIQSQAQAIVKIAINHCTKREWEIIRSIVIQERPSADVADELNITTANLRQIKSRSIKKIRLAIEEKKQVTQED